ncbi:hypothetical protein ABQF35_14480 [Mycobacterium syngnathidarum]
MATALRMIAGHWDSLGIEVCPASDLVPYDTAVIGSRPRAVNCRDGQHLAVAS